MSQIKCRWLNILKVSYDTYYIKQKPVCLDKMGVTSCDWEEILIKMLCLLVFFQFIFCTVYLMKLLFINYFVFNCLVLKRVILMFLSSLSNFPFLERNFKSKNMWLNWDWTHKKCITLYWSLLFLRNIKYIRSYQKKGKIWREVEV